jgi:hypothetical protein
MLVLQGDITNSPVQLAAALTPPDERESSVFPALDFGDDLDSSASFIQPLLFEHTKRAQHRDIGEWTSNFMSLLTLFTSTQQMLIAEHWTWLAAVVLSMPDHWDQVDIWSSGSSSSKNFTASLQ